MLELESTRRTRSRGLRLLKEESSIAWLGGLLGSVRKGSRLLTVRRVERLDLSRMLESGFMNDHSIVDGLDLLPHSMFDYPRDFTIGVISYVLKDGSIKSVDSSADSYPIAIGNDLIDYLKASTEEQIRQLADRLDQVKVCYSRA